MSATPLLLGYAPDAPITWIDGVGVSASQFCGLAAAVASMLPDDDHVVNLCEEAPRFLLGSAAAWIRGHAQVLPPDQLAVTLAGLLRSFPGAHALCDTPNAAAMAASLGLRVVDLRVLPQAPAVWPSPMIAEDLAAAYLHTSGSTGVPTRHRKTWSSLRRGAQAPLHAFGVPDPGSAILGTTAPQHMFGFETSILLTLQSGTPLLPFRPRLPGDLCIHLGEVRSLGRDRIWLFTTPLQLRAFHAAKRPQGLGLVITSTMPLPTDLGLAIEADWCVPVEEIYGCTEGGMLAYRRPARQLEWTAARGICFGTDATGATTVSGGHLAAEVRVADRVRLASPLTGPDQRFELLGREDDVVKIAGKRASLAGLNATLASLAGVEDGVFFKPTHDADRLCAAVVAPGRAEADVRRAIDEVIEPAFRPRRLLMLEALPRSSSQKVAVEALRRLVSGAHPATEAPIASSAHFRFDAADPVFAGHFPGHPIVPGVLLLERVCRELRARGYGVAELQSVKFHAAVAPGDLLEMRLRERTVAGTSFAILRGSTRVADGDVVLGPLE